MGTPFNNFSTGLGGIVTPLDTINDDIMGWYTAIQNQRGSEADRALRQRQLAILEGDWELSKQLKEMEIAKQKIAERGRRHFRNSRPATPAGAVVQPPPAPQQ